MFDYPLTFNSLEDHIAHVTENSQFYYDIMMKDIIPSKRQKVDDDEQMKKLLFELEMKNENLKSLTDLLTETQQKNSEQLQELEKTKERLNDVTELEDLLNKKSGISVVHKGSCDEKYVQVVLKEVIGDEYEVDNSNGIQKMDIRLIKKDGTITIGVECKDKDRVTESDITKFRRDKVLNKFHRSIFVSTNPIRGIAETDNSVVCNQDELFIVTKDPVFLAAVVKMYTLQLDDCEVEEPDTLFFDATIDTYNSWQTTKKSLIKLDKSFLRMLRLHPNFEENMINKNIYMATKSFLTSKFVKY